MKYLIAHLIKGKPAEYQEKLARKISEQFNVPCVSDRVAPHLTFKSPFEAINIKEVELLLLGWAGRTGPSKIRLKDFGNFRQRVVFIEALPSAEAGSAIDDLLEDLHCGPWMSLGPTDRVKLFHATVANLRQGRKFGAVWQFVRNFSPDFDIILDNVAILNLKRDRWHIYREYPLGR